MTLKYKLLSLFILFLMVNVSPACAVEIQDFNEDLEELEDWNQGSAWYKMWHFASLCKATHHLLDQTSEMAETVTQKANALKTPTLDTYPAHTSMDPARKDAQWVIDTINPQKSFGCVLEVQRGNPVVGSVVQFRVKCNVSGNYSEYLLHYWTLKEIQHNPQNQEVYVLNNGEKDITMSRREFQDHYTGIFLIQKDRQEVSTEIINRINEAQVDRLEAFISDTNGYPSLTIYLEWLEIVLDTVIDVITSLISFMLFAAAATIGAGIVLFAVLGRLAYAWCLKWMIGKLKMWIIEKWGTKDSTYDMWVQIRDIMVKQELTLT